MNEQKSGPVRPQKKRFRLEHWHVISLLLMLYDFIAIHVAYFFALWARFDFIFSKIDAAYLLHYKQFITAYAVCCLVVFWLFKLYRSMWRFASYAEFIRTLCASVLTSVLHAVFITLICGRMPMTYYFFGLLLQFLLLIAARFSFRFLLYFRERRRKTGENANRVMLIGAGSAGQLILRDLFRAPETNERVVCVIDDNPNKWGRYIEGIPIVGGRDDILANVEKYQVSKIFLAIPSASVADKRDILSICKETGCELKQLPGMFQFVTGQVSVKDMQDVSVEDLLGREPIRTDLREVFEFIHGKTVLVTGGGGSIGSELCRQIAAHDPRRLILFDIY